MSMMYSMDILNAIKKLVADSPREIAGRPILATVEQWQEKSNDLDMFLASWAFDDMDLPDDVRKYINKLRRKWTKQLK